MDAEAIEDLYSLSFQSNNEWYDPSQNIWDFLDGAVGAIRDKPDDRDKQWFPPPDLALLPDVNLTSKCPPVYNQFGYLSCTANAIAAAFEFELGSKGLQPFTPSRLFIWYYARLRSGGDHTLRNMGATIRDGLKSFRRRENTEGRQISGVCLEEQWPYVVDPVDNHRYFAPCARAALEPPSNIYVEAHHQIQTTYRFIERDLDHLRSCLTLDHPFIFSFHYYKESFTATGTLNMPLAGENAPTTHSVMAVGYNDETRHFIIRNSVGEDWGNQGYFMMPYDFIMSQKPEYAYDFWTIRLAEECRVSPNA